jgi:para-nitrobenzyl esterase
MITRPTPLGTALSILLLSAAVSRGAPADLQVRTDSGIVEGVAGARPGVRVFEGVPFAAAPVGDLRWREPQPVAPWEGVRKAAGFGPRAMQGAIFSDMIFRDSGPSEDCLYLNVWTPAGSAGDGLPVMVWIYGGGLQAGSSSEPRQDGGDLTKKGVIVVSMNYRLGVFGFFSHPELSRESGHGSGNYGLMDQIAALEWVHRNIAAFGGDPGKVTVFGESAGSSSVCALMASPLAKGLFQRAIGESGSVLGVRRKPSRSEALSAAESAGSAFAARVGARSIAGLRAMSAADLLKASMDDKEFSTRFVIDGHVLPKDPNAVYLEGQQSHVPLIVGWNADEQRVYSVFGSKRPTAESFARDVRAKEGAAAADVLRLYPARTDAEAVRSAGDLADDRSTCGMWKWIELQLATGGAPVFRYQFDRAVPVEPGTVINGAPATGADVGAVHASEISYVFGALASKKGVTSQPEDWRLSEVMETYWTNFAKTGNPNGEGAPAWPAYDGAGGYSVMHLGVTVAPAPDANRARYQFWDSEPARPAK